MSKHQVWTKRCSCGFFMPDEYVICDNCLLRKYALTSGYDACDQLGLGERHIEESAVITALRKAEASEPEEVKG